MPDAVIRAEGLGKKYLIGHQSSVGHRYVALRDVIGRAAKSVIRSASDIMRGRPLIVGDELEEVWVLKDVNFEIGHGEVVGIIGRNGAGKSTLLKVLSRITEPSAGRVEIRGRVASLLEVGTGFHPELTGRENIYLNGAILGMTRAEISRKFDEIVNFAGVERFLDTPVKRYSSGMYVRLAFAVAAHLEPEILVVDEVLAVGDAEFQKKCLGKIKDVAGLGRTVLFVSHNMAAVTSLTNRCIVLDKGTIVLNGPTPQAVVSYGGIAELAARTRETWGQGRHSAIELVRLLDDQGLAAQNYVAGENLTVEITVRVDGTRHLTCDMFLVDQTRIRLALASISHFEGLTLPADQGIYRVTMTLSPLNLAAGQYHLDVATGVANLHWDHYVDEALTFEVIFSNPGGLSWNYEQKYGFGTLALASASPTVIEKIKD